MSVTHNWKVRNLIQLNDGTGTVYKVEYQVNSVDGDFVVNKNESVQLFVGKIDNFIPYSELDETTVIGWVKSILGDKVLEYESKNEGVIQIMKTPPVKEFISEKLPWS